MFTLVCNSNQHLTEFIQIGAGDTVSRNYGKDTYLEVLSGPLDFPQLS